MRRNRNRRPAPHAEVLDGRVVRAHSRHGASVDVCTAGFKSVGKRSVTRTVFAPPRGAPSPLPEGYSGLQRTRTGGTERWELLEPVAKPRRQLVCPRNEADKCDFFRLVPASMRGGAHGTAQRAHTGAFQSENGLHGTTDLVAAVHSTQRASMTAVAHSLESGT